MKLCGSFSDCFATDDQIKHLFIGVGNDPDHPNDGTVAVVLELDMPQEDLGKIIRDKTTILRLNSPRNMHKFADLGEASRYYSHRACELINAGFIMLPNYTITTTYNLETDNLQNY